MARQKFSGPIKHRKVLLIAKNCYPYPVDTRLAQQLTALKISGIPADILCLRGNNQPDMENYGCVTIRRLMKNQGSQVGFFEYSISVFKFGILSLFTLLKLSFKNKYRIIVVHTLPEFLISIGLVHKLFGAKLFLDARDLSVELISSRWKSRKAGLLRACATVVERFCTMLCNEIITASSGFKRSLVSRGTPDRKITVLVNTADARIFKYDNCRKFAAIYRGLKLIYHGTVSERFGIIVAVEAMPLINKVIPESKLYIFGGYDLNYKAFIEKRIAELKLEGSVLLEGTKSLEEIYSILLTMHIGVVPYLSDSFMNLANSTKTFEYIASGLPVVESRLRSVEELFSDACIHYAEPGNPHDLAERIIEYCRNPLLRKQKSEKAYKEFSKYSSDLIAHLYIDLLRKYL